MKLLTYKVLKVYEEGTENEYEVLWENQSEVPDELFDQEYAAIQAKAYNGEVTVEEIPDPEIPVSDDVTWDSMAEAITKGVNEV